MTLDLSLSDDQQALSRLFGDFFAKSSPTSVVRKAEPLGFDPSLWQASAAVGLPGMGADVGDGGATLPQLVVVAEQFGRHIAPVPAVEHLVATRALGAEWEDLFDGSTIATLAVRPPASPGAWNLVPAGAVAGVVIGPHAGATIAIRSTPPGVAPRNHACAPIANRVLEEADRTELGPTAIWERALVEWKVLTAAALTGLADRALEIGVQYTKTREQFGQPIGAFQSVQHGLADLPGMVAGSRLLAHKAAWALENPKAVPQVFDVFDNEVWDGEILANMALIHAGDVAAEVTKRALHYHGGAGFAEEYDIQLYYRRARGWPLILGDPGRTALALADQLFGAVDNHAGKEN
ncbi:Acyl-CoA dehydrogenase [Mycolicibacterium vanbaalenii]|uniref:Acyl-CoA dehydrogenase n=1 Tax=Mycolicibacterium vanbaalenii TaxID=110539 RepID=A0A5S9RB01_MYCVN|nr:acyl-CoA dehydrogenase [Mycolicibacterium vanbaalenii]CAA0137572.1 Acyl-CoA dehydrogenase [Mycolicibacterium vanbaalenii]